jgi:hypothetical protein
LVIHDAVFNTDSPNLVFQVPSIVDIQTVSIAIASASVVAGIFTTVFKFDIKLKQGRQTWSLDCTQLSVARK